MKRTLLYLCLLVFLLWFASFREGFDISFKDATNRADQPDEYEYLKPHDPTVLDTTTENDFILAFNATTSAIAPDLNLTTNKAMLPSLKKDATLEEFQYYIKNDKWPYGSYITNYVTKNTDAVLKSFSWLKLSSMEDLQKLVSTRTVYQIAIYPTESKQSPPPLSNDIFTGKAQEPGSVSPLTSASSLSPEDFTKLKSICSNI